MACSENKNPLQRGGTSQQQRELAALKRGYVDIDERGYAEWIVFASEFAAYLNYYDLKNEVAGDWKPFFESDLSALLGSISIQDVDEYRRTLAERFKILKGDEIASSITNKKESLASLFAGIMTICKAIDDKTAAMPQDVDLKLTLHNLIKLKLQPALQKLIRFYKAAKSLNLLREQDLTEWKVFGLPVLKASTRFSAGLSPLWFGEAPTWEAYYAGIDEDQSIFGDAAWTNHRKMNHLANHNLFSGLFDQFLFSYSLVVKEAGQQLVRTLSNWNNHAPHYALFLAFLKLYRLAREEANQLTQRHLDFYYKDTLQLLPERAMPDHAHVVIELSRQTEAYLLRKGTLLKAGKDRLGKDLAYEVDRDVVINKAKVARIMSVYKGLGKDNIGTVTNQGRLFAAPQADSEDGEGKALDPVNKGWHPFVHRSYTDGLLSSIDMPRADIGLAVASHYLFLSEGERLIKVKFAPVFGAAQLAALSASNCYLTTEKGWLEVDGALWSQGQFSNSSSPAAMLSLNLAGDVPAISNYNPKVHGGSFTTTLPMLKVILRNENAATYHYDVLKDIALSKVEIEVKVGLNAANETTDGGIRNLYLSNDIGILDPAKPFLPFGPAPERGNALLIGNEEVFKKKNAKILFRVEWKGLPEGAYDIDYNYGADDAANHVYRDENPKVNAFTLQQGIWQPSDSGIGILSDFVYDYNTGSYSVNKQTLTFPGSALVLPDAAIADYRQPYGPYDIKAVKGFIKLSLSDGFGHQDYQKAQTKYLIALANGGSPSAPIEPYTPTIQKLSLHYTAYTVTELSDVSSFDQRSLQFYHLFPFGEAEQHRKLNNGEVRLLPQFKDPLEPTLHHEGELYLGFKDLQGGQSVNVLFQVLEGTGDPLLEKPAQHLRWSYLKQNEWKGFKKEEVSDGTGQFIQSGIISFVLPVDADTIHTMLPTGYVWIRASVREKSEAACKLIAIFAQAARLTFKDRDNAPEVMGKPLPAGNIARLKENNASIKKIIQPFASFGGRATEAEGSYYVRVSERLRHKGRAITIWDFEHLVLGAFPDIHRVKCLNHTRFEGNEYNEVAPGHVTLITIPDLEKRNDANPLRPYTNQDVLHRIHEFLSARISCHVKLHVRHPQFEEIRLDFKLKVFTGLEFNFYHDQLQQEITEYLTPWAFGRSASLEFGGKVHKSDLINFIEERSYVDYITEVKMYHKIAEGAVMESVDKDMIEASTGRSILVSAAAGKHLITEFTEGSSGEMKENCG